MRNHKFTRKVNHREVKKSFLILCEGENTERFYFKSFRLKNATVTPIPINQGDAKSFINESVIYKKNLRKEYDEYWVVFDKDNSSDNQFNQAINLAIKNKFKLAWSNKAFEYWYLCHFSYHPEKMDVNTLIKKLGNSLPFKYDKSKEVAKKMYAHLLSNQKAAIINAKKSLKEKEQVLSYAQKESATTVFQLVEELNRFID